MLLVTFTLALVFTAASAMFIWIVPRVLPHEIDSNHKKAGIVLMMITTYLWWTLITIITS
jgi:hypothetical protein